MFVMSIFNRLTSIRSTIKEGENKEPETVVLPIAIVPDKVQNEDGSDQYDLLRYLIEVAEGQGVGRVMEHYQMLDIEESTFAFYVESAGDQERIDLQDELGQTVLHLSAQYLDTTHIEKVINSGGSVTSVDNDGFTPLFYACISNNVDNVTCLLKNNSHITHATPDTGRQAVHIAAQYGAKDVLEFLLENGGDLDAEDAVRHTPIIVAAYYGKSDVCAMLLEKGANACIEDTSGIMGIMRIAATMPTLTREVLDGFVSEDIYQGERYFHLANILGTSGSTVFTSTYHYIVFLGNMGLVDHDIFEKLTETKWGLYAQRQANYQFFFLGVLLCNWSMLYVQPYSTVHDFKKIDGLYIFSGVVAVGQFIARLYMNFKVLRNRMAYMAYLQKLFSDTYQHETTNLHFKGDGVRKFLKKKYTKKITILDDIKSSPGILLDFIVDLLLIIYLIIKLTLFCIEVEKAEDLNKFTLWTDLYGGVVVIMMWLSAFIKLQITSVGPFVIYMGAVGNDLATIGTMFTCLFIPALCVFYKTVYVNSETIPWYEVIFMVARMSLSDYDYGGGLALSSTYPIWWQMLSFVWIVVAALIILNLLVALMADSYNRLSDASELQGRLCQARFISEYERSVSAEEMKRFDDVVRANFSPLVETFDPVCDRETIDIVKENLDSVGKLVANVQSLVDKRLKKELRKKLSEVKEGLTLYNSSG